jgi:hypothetical protein
MSYLEDLSAFFLAFLDVEEITMAVPKWVLPVTQVAYLLALPNMIYIIFMLLSGFVYLSGLFMECVLTHCAILSLSASGAPDARVDIRVTVAFIKRILRYIVFALTGVLTIFLMGLAYYKVQWAEVQLDLEGKFWQYVQDVGPFFMASSALKEPKGRCSYFKDSVKVDCLHRHLEDCTTAAAEAQAKAAAEEAAASLAAAKKAEEAAALAEAQAKAAEAAALAEAQAKAAAEEAAAAAEEAVQKAAEEAAALAEAQAKAAEAEAAAAAEEAVQKAAEEAAALAEAQAKAAEAEAAAAAEEAAAEKVADEAWAATVESRMPAFAPQWIALAAKPEPEKAAAEAAALKKAADELEAEKAAVEKAAAEKAAFELPLTCTAFFGAFGLIVSVLWS